MLTYILTGNVCSCSYTWIVQLSKQYTIWISPSSAASGSSGSSSLFYRAEEVDGLEEKGSGDTTTVDE
jgi:hypothetical protein